METKDISVMSLACFVEYLSKTLIQEDRYLVSFMFHYHFVQFYNYDLKVLDQKMRLSYEKGH